MVIFKGDLEWKVMFVLALLNNDGLINEGHITVWDVLVLFSQRHISSDYSLNISCVI